MIKAYMQADLNNPLAVRYMEYALKSFDRVSDIFKIEVVQCITPDNFLPELMNTCYWPGKIKRTLGELGSYHSNYRMMKRISSGERFWVMEHDAFLVPENENVFRKYMSKWMEMDVMLLGTATEIWTVKPHVAKVHCEIVESGTLKGTMSVMHTATDVACKNLKTNRVYWPANRFRNANWINKTGIGRSASQAHHKPSGVENAPCTQLIDPKFGSSIAGRNMVKSKIGGEILSKYNSDLHVITLD